ncbi:MAG: CHAT domain-containing protein [Saprospiraceae bacterium]|nr:CHAT domain-containing protein [Lewinella sp.]
MSNLKKRPQSPDGLRTTLLLLLLLIGLINELPAYTAYSTDPEEQREAADIDYARAVELRGTDPVAADLLFLNTQQVYEHLELWNKASACTIYRCQLNYDLERMDSLDRALDQAQSIIDNHDLKGENFRQERIYYFRAMLFDVRAQYEEAQEMLTRASSILEALEHPEGLDSSYMSSHKTLSGAIYYGRGDYETAINRYQTALNLFPISRPNEAKLLNIYNNLGLALLELGRVSEGMQYLEASLKILPQLDQDIYFNDYLQTYFNLIKGHLLLKDTEQAKTYLTRALPLLQKKQDDQHIWFSLRAQVDEELQHWPAALLNYQQALSRRILIRGRYHPSIARLYRSIGMMHQKMGDQQAAMEAYQQGLRVFDPEFRTDDLFGTPSLQDVTEYYPLIQLLKDRGDLLMKQYPSRAGDILPTFRIAIQAIDNLRLLYESDASKLLLSQEAKSVFASAITLLYQLHRLSPKREYIEEAFRYMEKTKALLLLENIRKWRNIRLTNSGRSKDKQEFNDLLEKEKNAKLDLVLLQRLIKDAREQDQDDSHTEKIITLEQALRKVTALYESVKDELAGRFPQYYEASYGEKVAELSAVQQKLLANDDTALVSYFINGEHSFAILLTEDSATLEQLASPAAWEEDFQDYQETLRTPGGAVLQDTIFQKYAHSAASLYSHLLNPLLRNLRKSYRRLYLLPDDRLGFLAFESLLVTPTPDNPVDYSPDHLDYLLEHFALAYGYSATLLVESIKRQHIREKRKNYGGFAPVFGDHSTGGRAVSRDCTTGELMYLPYSGESVTATSTLYKGDAFLNEQATLKNFVAVAQDYRILQLSTHACVDNSNALFNVLYFSDTTLANYEIFDIPIRADLIILSACETGNGDLLQGEGIMSLSRGFYYAGSSNVITSLWPADDHATKEMMILLNRKLKKGLDKDEALRQTKLDYLRSGKLRKANLAPSIWANFILIGNQQRIDFSYSPLLLISLAVACILLAIAALIFFHRTRSRH